MHVLGAVGPVSPRHTPTPPTPHKRHHTPGSIFTRDLPANEHRTRAFVAKALAAYRGYASTCIRNAFLSALPTLSNLCFRFLPNQMPPMTLHISACMVCEHGRIVVVLYSPPLLFISLLLTDTHTTFFHLGHSSEQGKARYEVTGGERSK